MTTTEFSAGFDTLETRRAAFEHWVTTVRDPAEKNSEGLRVLRTSKGKAQASYRISPLPDGRFAIQMNVEYHSGDCRSFATPWEVCETREACVNLFLDTAKNHFGQLSDRVSEGQRKAQKEMMDLLIPGGLFPEFVEPSPEPE